MGWQESVETWFGALRENFLGGLGLLPRLTATWEKISTSLWFLPALIVLSLSVVAWLALHVELGTSKFVWWLHQGGAEEAGRLLSALLTSLITMATLVISITMVVLTLAAGQLGPRLIRSFVADRRTQIVLGLFIGTVVYILLIFRLLDGGLPKEEVPRFAVTMASVLTFVCLFALLFYVHHLSRSIVADTVVSRVGGDLDHAIHHADAEDDGGERHVAGGSDGAVARFSLAASGYVQAIDYRHLVEVAAANNAELELLVRPGHHVLAGRTHAFVRPALALDDSLREAIAGAVVVGSVRTPVQDVEFFVRQLVEIALRALSPGINDPFTAVAVIDRLSVSLDLAMRKAGARRLWRDGEGTVRVIASIPDFDGLVDLGFNQIRQAAAGCADILIRLMDTLGALAEAPCEASQAATLARHMDAVMETGRQSVSHSHDLAALERRYNDAKNRFGRDGGGSSPL